MRQLRGIPIIGQPTINTTEIKRPPVSRVCRKCHRTTVLILPQWPGKITWKCPCGQDDLFEFGSAVEASVEQIGSIQLQRPHVLHECDTCGVQDYFAVPGPGGELRWSCQCGTVWSFRWLPKADGGTQWMRGKVSNGTPLPTVRIPTRNLCGCGQEGCPHCNP